MNFFRLFCCYILWLSSFFFRSLISFMELYFGSYSIYWNEFKNLDLDHNSILVVELCNVQCIVKMYAVSWDLCIEIKRQYELNWIYIFDKKPKKKIRVCRKTSNASNLIKLRESSCTRSTLPFFLLNLLQMAYFQGGENSVKVPKSLMYKTCHTDKALEFTDDKSVKAEKNSKLFGQ